MDLSLEELVEPVMDQPKSVAPSDQKLSVDEMQFYGLYYGSRLPSGTSVINDSRSMPKSARVLFHNIIQLPDKRGSMGLYDLVKFGGGPLAEDIGDQTLIHDDPRKASHKPALYDMYTSYILKTRFSFPFHTYALDGAGTRKFLKMIRVPASLTSKSNNVISPHKSGPVVDGDKINIILSATGSGKTHFIERNPHFQDADLILKWPSDTKWLDDSESIHHVNIGLWQQLAEYKGNRILLYNGSLKALPPYLENKFRFVGLVEIPIDDHISNLESRKKLGGPQPTDWELVKINREDLHDQALKRAIPKFYSFASASAFVGRYAHRLVSSLYREGVTQSNITETALKIISPNGLIDIYGQDSRGLTYGSHVSMRIHTNEYARFSGMTQHMWRHLTRNYPQAVVLASCGFPFKMEMTLCGHIGKITIEDNEISASGHMLGMFTWLAFPHARVAGMPQLYPDFHTYLVMYLLNQKQVTPSLEPYNPDVAYHRWVETLAGIIGSYVAIKILLRRGLKMRRRDFILWRLYTRRAIRGIVINERTWYLNTKFDRDNDKRFGPILHP